ncbi:MAG: aspartate--ammonia ligase [Myxococcales bacterium]|nr:MAG: aspartate--ammonia ligase [Myxococcales bacterium]
MAPCRIPEGYRTLLDTLEMEAAIKRIKDFFELNLSRSLNLRRVSAPLFVRAGTGVNDDLNGVERPVRFRVKGDGDAEAEIVHSLAKWKRMALKLYGFPAGGGLYTDMNAIRPDEDLDNLHSIYVDQWDWELIIDPAERTLEKLRAVVATIYDALCRTEFFIASIYPSIRPLLPERIAFVTAEELAARWPDLAPKEREDRILEEKRAVFLIGIGHDLPDGKPHDGRAPDYDDWSTPRPDGGRGLNGDILLWHPVLEQAFEISSMGIRVDAEALRRQLAIRGKETWADREFHRMLLNGELPQTMGGGIGQSRLCMFFLRTAHIGEVAVGLWPDSMQQQCRQAGIVLL